MRLIQLRYPSVVLMILAVVVAACGNGGDDSAAACDAFVAVDQAFTIDEDADAGIAALERLAAAVPQEVATDVEPAIALLKEDPEAALESPEVAIAEAALDVYALDHCDGDRVDVTTVDYAFDGAPSQLDAGRVIFTFTNHATREFHEALILRKHEGVTASALDLLTVDEGSSVSQLMVAFEQLSLVGATLLEPAGGDSQDVFAVDLEPGDYILVCALPLDSPQYLEAYFAGEELSAVPSHFEAGMVTEFAVK